MPWHMGVGRILSSRPAMFKVILLVPDRSGSILFFVDVSTRGQPGKGDGCLVGVLLKGCV